MYEMSAPIEKRINMKIVKLTWSNDSALPNMKPFEIEWNWDENVLKKNVQHIIEFIFYTGRFECYSLFGQHIGRIGSRFLIDCCHLNGARRQNPFRFSFPRRSLFFSNFLADASALFYVLKSSLQLAAAQFVRRPWNLVLKGIWISWWVNGLHWPAMNNNSNRCYWNVYSQRGSFSFEENFDSRFCLSTNSKWWTSNAPFGLFANRILHLWN